ncbi:hypothetical protein CDD83_10311 [Cordyceps sp. RAO-2017]|nr:hypothetical protein CDD83_10311 [Cordyceps sp. RAO-2017]
MPLGARLVLLRQKVNALPICGPGAAILPPEVSMIHMDFCKDSAKGHMGSRKFWRQQLPRLKYYNPSIPMIVNRHNNNDQAPLMTIYLRNDPQSSSNAVEAQTKLSSSCHNNSKAQPPGPNHRVIHIDMKMKHSTEILESFMVETRAQKVQPTSEDIVEMQELEAIKAQNEAKSRMWRRSRPAKERGGENFKKAKSIEGSQEQAEA